MTLDKRSRSPNYCAEDQRFVDRGRAFSLEQFSGASHLVLGDVRDAIGPRLPHEPPRPSRPAPASHGVTLRGVVHTGLLPASAARRATMPGHLTEMRRCESHQTWKASS